jgi:hypothetical protein
MRKLFSVLMSSAQHLERRNRTARAPPAGKSIAETCVWSLRDHHVRGHFLREHSINVAFPSDLPVITTKPSVPDGRFHVRLGARGLF